MTGSSGGLAIDCRTRTSLGAGGTFGVSVLYSLAGIPPFPCYTARLRSRIRRFVSVFSGGSPTSPLVSSSLSLASLAAGLDDWRREALEAVRQAATDAGLSAYLVGGPVRDALLGVAALDLDFSVEGDAIALARQVSERLGGQVTAHQRFGTATVVAAAGRLDLVTARRESYLRPGDLPRVTPGSIADDLARRDFSINALALPLCSSYPEILDFHGGLEDLSAGVVRTLHRDSFTDDPTRMMRAVRYERRFGFVIHPDALAQMADCLRAGHMAAASGDRWRHEIERILEEDNPGAPLARASELGLLAGIHPSLAVGKMKGLDGLGKRAASIGQPLQPEEWQPEDWLAAMFSQLTAGEGESVVERLRLSGHWAALARDTITIRDMEPTLLTAAGRPSRLVALLSSLELSAVSAWAKLTDDASVAALLRRYVEEFRFVRPVLSGYALLNLGARQGPEVGTILARLLEARLDGEVASQEQEIALAMEMLAEDRGIQESRVWEDTACDHG